MDGRQVDLGQGGVVRCKCAQVQVTGGQYSLENKRDQARIIGKYSSVQQEGTAKPT